MSAATLPRLLLLLTAVLFSTGAAAIKSSSLTGLQLGCLRAGVAAAFLAIALPGWHRSWNARTALVGLAFAATTLLYATANKLTTAASAIFLQSSAPIYLLLLGPWLLRERWDRRDVLFLLALAGGMLLLFMGSSEPVATAPDPAAGNLLAALAGLGWALTILGLRWLGRSGSDGQSAAGAAVVSGNATACLVTLPFAWPFVGATALDWSIVGYLGLFQIGLAYVCLTRAIRHLPALEASLLLLLEPVLNPAWAWWIHREQPSPLILAGGGLILAATLLRTFAPSRSGRESAPVR